jgi:hypothetical protein
LVQQVYRIEDRLLEELKERRKRLYELVFPTGFDARYGEVIEALYFDRQAVVLEGDITAGLEDELREGNAYREKFLAGGSLKRFERDLERLLVRWDEIEDELLLPLLQVQMEVK